MIKNVCYIMLGIMLLGCKGSNSSVMADRQLKVNNQPYFIKGICYHPVPVGSSKRDFSDLSKDLGLMLEAGINTIRVYEPIDDAKVLNEINAKGIKVIIGFGYDQNGDYDIKSGSYLKYVQKYKNHPAILMWELGNEYNYHPEWFEGDLKNWYIPLNNAAQEIHKEDKSRPVATAHGELPDQQALALCPAIDVWGMNVYRWDDPSKIFAQWRKRSTKPMYLSEAGADSYMHSTNHGYKQGRNEKAQADANAKILDAVFEHKNIGSGVALFSFTDGWWKAGNNEVQDNGGIAPNSTGVPYDGTPNEEHWGIVDIYRNKKATFAIVQEKYNGKSDQLVSKSK